MSPGRPTLGDVARVAGVHKATASRALNPATLDRVHPDTAQRVRAAADDLGYRPNMNARGLRLQSTKSVGLVVPDILNPLYPPFIRGAEKRLAASGYSTLIANSELDPEAERMAIDSLLSRQVDGIIAGVTVSGQELCADVAARGLPVVSLTRPLDLPGVGTVETDSRSGIELIVALVIGLGHRHIGHVAGPSSYVDPITRLAHLRQALAGVRPELPTLSVLEPDELSIAGGQAATSALLARHPEITAVIAYNDTLAIGALHAVRAAGLRCPDDITVIGFNDVPLVGELTPPLTTVFNDTRRQGDACAEVLLRMLAGETPDHVNVGVTLVERGSHGPVRPRA